MLNSFTGAGPFDFSGGAGAHGGVPKRLASWHIANNGATPCVVSFQDGDGAEQFQVCLPANASASQSYPSPLYLTKGWKVVLTTAGTFSRGNVDLI